MELLTISKSRKVEKKEKWIPLRKSKIGNKARRLRKDYIPSAKVVVITFNVWLVSESRCFSEGLQFV